MNELNLLKLLINQANLGKTHFDIANSIAFIYVNSKFHYDRKNSAMIFVIGNNALLQLYKSYSILSALN